MATVSEERQQIFAKLRERLWFQRTSEGVQIELALLPETGRDNFNGFLTDLAARPESCGNVLVLSLERIARGNFGIIPIFNVMNEKGEHFTYEYFS